MYASIRRKQEKSKLSLRATRSEIRIYVCRKEIVSDFIRLQWTRQNVTSAVTLPPKISKLTNGLHEDCPPAFRLFKIHMTSRITAAQSQDEKHTHSHYKFQIQRFQSITITSKDFTTVLLQEKRSPENTHTRKHWRNTFGVNTKTKNDCFSVIRPSERR